MQIILYINILMSHSGKVVSAQPSVKNKEP